MDNAHCCADCGSVAAGDGISLKICGACMFATYCSATCQRNHWPKHKKECKQRAAELRDEALFKDPPPKEDCPICFLPMPFKFIACITLPPATITSVPIYNLVSTNAELANENTEIYYSCCGKTICRGCVYSLCKSGNIRTCPYCKAESLNKTDVEIVEEMMKRVVANDAGAMCVLGDHYYYGQLGLLPDQKKAIELWKQAAKLGSSQAHFTLGHVYYDCGDVKKEKFHFEAAAMAGHEVARFSLGYDEYHAGNVERAIKHYIIAASVGHCGAMHNLLVDFKQGLVSRDSVDSTLAAYNNSCVEMRSEARDAEFRSEARDAAIRRLMQVVPLMPAGL